MAKNDDAIPAGQERVAPPEESKPDTAASKIKVGDKEYGSVDDLAKAYSNLQERLGSQGKQLGELKGQRDLLTNQLQTMQQQFQSMQQQPQQQAPQSNDYEAMMGDIYNKIENGDITYEDGLRESQKLTAMMVKDSERSISERAINKSQEMFQSELQKRDATQQYQNWLKNEAPDFEELRDSGALSQVMNKNPMHDELSAYYALKAHQASAAANDAASKIRQGAESTGTVLSKPGSTVRNTNPLTKPRSTGDRRMAMLQAAMNAGG